MAYCYRCGKQLHKEERRLRRKVPTGNWVRTRALQRGGRVAQSHFGMRIVCDKCARIIDLTEMRSETAWLFQLGLALAALLILTVLKYWSF